MLLGLEPEVTGTPSNISERPDSGGGCLAELGREKDSPTFIGHTVPLRFVIPVTAALAGVVSGNR